MNFRSILVVTDFSASAAAAVDRAALLAALHGAKLTLMYAAKPGAQHPADAAVRLDHSAQQLAQRTGLDVCARCCFGDPLTQIAREASCADLLVLGDQHDRSLAAFMRGTMALRLSRLCRCPILVTKLAARKRYGKILVTVDFAPASQGLVKLACAIDGDSEIELFHAISTLNDAKLRAAEVSWQAIKAYRQRARRHAHERMFALTDSFQARRNRVGVAIGHGDPARQAAVQQDYTGADLVIVGRRRRSPWADFLFGSVAQRLLGWAGCDVIMVPHDHAPSTRTAAQSRLRVELRTGRSRFLPRPRGSA